MKLRFLTIALACSAALTAAAGDRTGVTDYFNADFNHGMPDGIMTTDGDGQKLHFLMIQAGFDQGDSWKIFRESPSGNYYVASPSMHENASAAADDRLELPEIYMRGGDGLLSWKCRSINEQSDRPSTYSVVINGKEVVSHVEAPVGRSWTSCDLSLDEYTGKRVKIEFVNNTTNGEVLALDDIVVSGLPGLASVTMVPGRYALGGDSFRIGATFTATSDVAVTSVGITCLVNGQTYTAKTDGLNLTTGQQTTLTLDREFSLKLGSDMSYTVTPSVNGVDYDYVDCITTPLVFMPHKRVVVEEGTGMWCGWCPLGIVATDSLQMLYGDDIIPIAIHFNGTSDVLAMDDYASALKITGAPIGLFDRTSDCEPLILFKQGPVEKYVMGRGGFGTLAAECFAHLPEADIKAEMTRRTARQVDITTTTRFATNTDASYKIALVMIEDDVWRSGYYQSNYLANYPNRGPVGDFTERPAHITSDFKFQHVARAVADNAYTGIAESVPATIEAGKEYTFTKTMIFPGTVNTEKASVVALLLNAKTGAVVNACKISVAENSGLTLTPDDAEQLSVAPGSVTVKADGTVSATLIDMAGRTVATAEGNGSVTLTAPRGIYVLRTAGGATRIRL